MPKGNEEERSSFPEKSKEPVGGYQPPSGPRRIPIGVPTTEYYPSGRVNVAVERTEATNLAASGTGPKE